MTGLDPRREQYAGAITEHLWGSPEDVDEAASGVMELADQEAKELRRQVDIADSVTAETKRLLERRTKTLRERADRAEAVIERVRRLATAISDATAAGRNDWQIGQHDCALTVLAALGEPAPAATEATDGERCCGKPSGAVCVHDITPPADQTTEA